MNSAGKAQQLRASKGRQRIAALTAYDYPMARLLDDAGMDVLLVGDSLGMVVLGFPDTTHVTLEHMVHHTAAVARANPRAMVKRRSCPEPLSTAQRNLFPRARCTLGGNLGG